MIAIIGGKFKRHSLITPKNQKTRPTTSQLRETLFNICQHSISQARFLDIFAGSGAVGLEALSRGASHATFIENNRQALLSIRQNISLLKVDKEATVYGCDALKALALLSAQEEQFDLIYADPPYGAGWGAKILQMLDQSRLLAPEGSLFIEEENLEESALKSLKQWGCRRAGRASLFEFRLI